MPQGSVLNPLFFLISFNNIDPHLHTETKVACYADHIAIWHSGKNLKQFEYSLNHALEGISNWSNSLKLKINLQKTSCSIFSADRKHRLLFLPNRILSNQPLSKTENSFYLGIYPGSTSAVLFNIG